MRLNLFATQVCVALLFTTPALAQDAARVDVGSTDQEARGLFLAGRSALEGGRFAEALGHFRRAHELSGRPALLFNIGVAADRLRRDDEAIEAFERYLAELPGAENRRDVEARLQVLRVQRAPPTDATATTTSPSTPPPSRSSPTVVPWIVTGIGAAVAVVGGVLLGVAASSASTVDAAMGVEWSTVSGDYDRADAFGLAGAVLLGVGAAAMAGGLVWVLVGRGAEDETSAGATVHATLGPAGVVIGGTF